MPKYWPLLCGAVLLAGTVEAQTVINPNTVQFTVSADHNTVVAGVGNLVQSYEVRWYAAGATAPVSTSNLGKPTPDAQGVAQADVTQVIIAFPVDPGRTYTARIVALGVAGSSAESTSSNPFLHVAAPQAVGAVTLVRK